MNCVPYSFISFWILRYPIVQKMMKTLLFTSGLAMPIMSLRTRMMLAWGHLQLTLRLSPRMLVSMIWLRMRWMFGM